MIGSGCDVFSRSQGLLPMSFMPWDDRKKVSDRLRWVNFYVTTKLWFPVTVRCNICSGTPDRGPRSPLSAGDAAPIVSGTDMSKSLLGLDYPLNNAFMT